jgi:hypothetical protein
MARTPQSFEKRQRERRKQLKREEKLERRLIRSEEKKLAGQEQPGQSEDSEESSASPGTGRTPGEEGE